MKRQIILGALVGVAVFAGVALGDKKGKQVHYVGIHPIAKGHGKGLCHIEVPHIHVYGPTQEVQYRDYHGDHYFVGDPVAYGWDGDRHSYYGHHPIYVDAVVTGGAPGEPEWCYLDGPHFHHFEPPLTVATDFEVKADAYFYIGTPPPVYVEARPALVKINAVYTPIEYERPVVVVEPPSAWIGVRFPVVVAPAVVVDGHGHGRGHGHGHVGVEVVAPAVEIRPPSLSVDVGISVGGGVVVGGGGGHKHKVKGKRHGKHRKWKR